MGGIQCASDLPRLRSRRSSQTPCPLPEVSLPGTYRHSSSPMWWLPYHARPDPHLLGTTDLSGHSGGGSLSDSSTAGDIPEGRLRFDSPARLGGTCGQAAGEETGRSGQPCQGHLARCGRPESCPPCLDRPGLWIHPPPRGNYERIRPGSPSQRNLFLPLFDPLLPSPAFCTSAFT